MFGAECSTPCCNFVIAEVGLWIASSVVRKKGIVEAVLFVAVDIGDARAIAREIEDDDIVG